MNLLRKLFRPERALAALLLLASLLVGQVADARHHLSDHGCPGDTGGRADHCACASLHAVSLADEAPAQWAPVEMERDLARAANGLAPIARAVISAAPRAPPQG